MGVIRDLLRFRRQAKELRDQMPAPDLRELLGAASGTMDEVPELLNAVVDAQAEAERLQTEGVEGTATLVAVRDTGVTIGTGGQENPLAELDLDVSVGDEPPTRVTSRQVVPRLAVGRLTPGSTLSAMVDPLDHAKVLIDWDAPVSG